MQSCAAWRSCATKAGHHRSTRHGSPRCSRPRPLVDGTRPRAFVTVRRDYLPNAPATRRLLEGDAVDRPHRAAHHVSERHAVPHCSPARDDIGVGYAVAVAVESPIIHDYRLIPDERVCTRRGGENESDVAAIALERVANEQIATR